MKIIPLVSEKHLPIVFIKIMDGQGIEPLISVTVNNSSTKCATVRALNFASTLAYTKKIK